MKKLSVFSAMLAWSGLVLTVALAFGLALAGCDTSGDQGGANETLTLSGKVYFAPPGEDAVEFTGNELNLEADYGEDLGGSGNIIDGELSFTINTPAYVKPFVDFLVGYVNLQITPTDAQGVYLILYTSSFSHRIERLDLNNWNYLNEWNNRVSFLYADRDVHITGTGASWGDGRTSDVNLRLKKGWNVISETWNLVNGEPVFSETLGDNSSYVWIMHTYQD